MNGPGAQRLHFDEGSGITFKNESVVSCSKRIAVLLFIVAVFLIAGVALIVYFVAPPRGGCKTLDEEAQWKVCKTLAAKRGECLCQSTTTHPVTPTTLRPPKPKPAAPTHLRLNKTILPYHYKVELQPHIYNRSGEEFPLFSNNNDGFEFEGSVEIYVTCNETTDVIVMHMEEIVLNETSLEIIFISNNKMVPIPLARWEQDVQRQFLKLYPTQDLIVGEQYVIRMKFNGTLLHRDLCGFYLAFYKSASGENRFFASTYFQPAYTRRAFPCFDEPSFKATFDVTLVRRAGYSTISNMPVVAQEPRGDGWVADVHDTTVKMSTYLLAFVVSDFKNKTYTTSKGTVFRHWSQPELIDFMNYSLTISGTILEAFEDWTNVSYPLPETDQIAVPILRVVGMENWGLITYATPMLMHNPAYSRTASLVPLIRTISHELAHQWFGNLVTCDWWDDTWLNEGFASYFEQIGAMAVASTWNMDQDFIIHTMQTALDVDGKGRNQPVYLPNLEQRSDQERAFSTSAYRKGASVIRMMKFFLGEDTFREGVREYLKKYAYGTAKREDLYTVLERVAVRKGSVTWNTRKANLSSIMQTWVDQSNYPVVEVTDNKNTTITISQRHFLYDENDTVAYPSPIGRFIWDIPFTYANQAQVKSGSPKLQWMHREQSKLITGVQGGWQLANLWQQGFYRVKYDADTWTAIIKQLMTNHRVFPVLNRAQLIDDAFKLVVATLMTETDALRATEYLRYETEYVPLYTFIHDRMTYYDRMFYGTSSYDALQTYFLGLITKPYSKLQWDDSDVTKHLEKLHRAKIFQEACDRWYRPCIEQATSLYQKFMNNSAVNPISPDWRGTVYCTGIRHGGFAEWQFAKQMYEKEYVGWTGAEKNELMESMACTQEPWLLRRYIDYALEQNETGIAMVMMESIASHPAGQNVIWSFLKERWNTWPSKVSKGRLISALTKSLSTPNELAMLERFISDYPDSSLTSTYDTVVKTTKKNMEWMAKHQKPIEAWLRATNAKYAQNFKN